MSQKLVRLSLVWVALLTLGSLPAVAQTPFAPPPQIPYGLPISTESAKNAGAASIAEARRNNWTMAIAIVDTGGYLVYFEKMQDTQTGSVDLAIEKADVGLVQASDETFSGRRSRPAAMVFACCVSRAQFRMLAVFRSLRTARLLGPSARRAAVSSRMNRSPKAGANAAK